MEFCAFCALLDKMKMRRNAMTEDNTLLDETPAAAEAEPRKPTKLLEKLTSSRGGQSKKSLYIVNKRQDVVRYRNLCGGGRR